MELDDVINKLEDLLLEVNAKRDEPTNDVEILINYGKYQAYTECLNELIKLQLIQNLKTNSHH